MTSATTGWPLAKTAGILSLIIPLAVGAVFYLPVTADLSPHWPPVHPFLAGRLSKGMSPDALMALGIPWLILLSYFVLSLLLSGRKRKGAEIAAPEPVVFRPAEGGGYICAALNLSFRERPDDARAFVLRDIDSGEERVFPYRTRYGREEIEVEMTVPRQETYTLGQKVFPFERMKTILYAALGAHTDAVHGPSRKFVASYPTVLFVSPGS